MIHTVDNILFEKIVSILLKGKTCFRISIFLKNRKRRIKPQQQGLEFAVGGGKFPLAISYLRPIVEINTKRIGKKRKKKKKGKKRKKTCEA